MTTRYLATVNVPGYMPMDDDPPTFQTASEAWAYLAHDREYAEDDLADDADGRPYSTTVVELLDLSEKYDATEVGTVYGDTPGYDGDHDLGLAYTVSEVEVDTAHAWQYGRWAGTKTCERCGLLPLDDDDTNSECPGTRY